MTNLPFLELQSQSNTNSESATSTVFRIGSNQTLLVMILKEIVSLTYDILNMV